MNEEIFLKPIELPSSFVLRLAMSADIEAEFSSNLYMVALVLVEKASLMLNMLIWIAAALVLMLIMFSVSAVLVLSIPV